MKSSADPQGRRRGAGPRVRRGTAHRPQPPRTAAEAPHQRFDRGWARRSEAGRRL